MTHGRGNYTADEVGLHKECKEERADFRALLKSALAASRSQPLRRRIHNSTGTRSPPRIAVYEGFFSNFV